MQGTAFCIRVRVMPGHLAYRDGARENDFVRKAGLGGLGLPILRRRTGPDHGQSPGRFRDAIQCRINQRHCPRGDGIADEDQPQRASRDGCPVRRSGQFAANRIGPDDQTQRSRQDAGRKFNVVRFETKMAFAARNERWMRGCASASRFMPPRRDSTSRAFPSHGPKPGGQNSPPAIGPHTAGILQPAVRNGIRKV